MLFERMEACGIRQGADLAPELVEDSGVFTAQFLDNTEGFAMKGTRPVLSQRLLVFVCAIPFVAVKAILRKNLVKFYHELVPPGFGNN